MVELSEDHEARMACCIYLSFFLSFFSVDDSTALKNLPEAALVNMESRRGCPPGTEDCLQFTQASHGLHEN